jgi:hypothetical protein
MEAADKQASNFRNSPEDGGVHYVKPPYLPKVPKHKKLFPLWRGPHPAKMPI